MNKRIHPSSSRIDEIKKYFVLNRVRGKSMLSSSIGILWYLAGRVLGIKKEPLNNGNVLEGFQLYSRPLLISYSRSGTNWIRYIIEYLSQQPTPGYVRSRGGVNFVIDRAHAGYKNIRNYKKVMLVIRNYKECLVRHHGIDFVKSFDSIADYLESDSRLQRPDWYIKNIKAFDEFDGEKMVVYYEDMLTDAVGYSKKIAVFLALDNQRLDNLINNIEDHKKLSVELYKHDHDSVTAGDITMMDYHSRHDLSDEDRHAFDDYYQKKYPELFSKYLERYKS